MKKKNIITIAFLESDSILDTVDWRITGLVQTTPFVTTYSVKLHVNIHGIF